MEKKKVMLLTKKEADLKLRLALVKVIEKSNAFGFLTYIVFNTKHSINKIAGNSACTDGRQIYYSIDLISNYDVDLITSVIMHEVWHIALNHVGRLGSKSPRIWNYAGDHVVNYSILQSGLPLGKDWLHDKKFDGMSTDEIYEILIKEANKKSKEAKECEQGEEEKQGEQGETGEQEKQGKQEEQGEQGEQGGQGEDVKEGGNQREENSKGLSGDLLPVSDEDREQATKFSNEVIVGAQVDSEMRRESKLWGNVPKELEIHIEELLNPKVRWSSLLRKFMRNTVKGGYTFAKKNRRYIPYLPSRSKVPSLDIALAMDTSGSMVSEDYIFMGEMKNIFKQIKVKEITILQFDTKIIKTNVVKKVQDMNFEVIGGGGTEANCVLEWANKHKPKMMVILTDGYFPEITEKTKVPIIWIIIGNDDFKTTTGKVIHYEKS